MAGEGSNPPPTFQQVVGGNTPPNREPGEISTGLMLTPGEIVAKERFDLAKATLNSISPTSGSYTEEAHKAAMDEFNAATRALVEAKKAADEARAQVAAANQPPARPASPVLEDGRRTHDALRAIGDQIRYDIRQELTSFGARMAAMEATGLVAAPAQSGKTTYPNPSKFSGQRSSASVGIQDWCLQFESWCTLQPIPEPKMVRSAEQCLEGTAVHTWFNLKRQLTAAGQDTNIWSVMKAALIKQYAEVSPDIGVRDRLVKLRQGTGSVQDYHDKFLDIISQAEEPIVGANAIWFFKQGLNQNIRNAIAAYGDCSLDAVITHAKRVDVNYSLTAGTPAGSSNITKSNFGTGKKNKNSSSGSGMAPDPKRPKPSQGLITVRCKEHVCTNCRGTREKHPVGQYGGSCTKPFVEATPEELKAIAALRM